ncbi:hypothetical protein KUTeg_005247 [Tegillarca granosa]|uniref:Uncharacterized protein n=1 Tax=Tegillarca granosa TaxID=220873 RepID=A0ABQ9FJ65_TEGGR|nr:hypothetical protein KUTeg_005247 [Tegillarca granosa]
MAMFSKNEEEEEEEEEEYVFSFFKKCSYDPVNSESHPNVQESSMALKKKCNNAEHPDKYGHYREAKYCQTKHHWLWKGNCNTLTMKSRYSVSNQKEQESQLQHVFDKLDVMKNYTGHVLLLEEDYYVAPDGILLPLSVQESEEYCLFDDYNWDWTLQHLSMKCIPGKVRVMKMKATRVFHMGEWYIKESGMSNHYQLLLIGVHHKGKNCNPQVKKKQVETLLSSNKKYLFPNVLSISGSSKLKLRDPKPNGGWGDIRDRHLCLSLVDDYPGKPPS